jgi:hypothetical protein
LEHALESALVNANLDLLDARGINDLPDTVLWVKRPVLEDLSDVFVQRTVPVVCESKANTTARNLTSEPITGKRKPLPGALLTGERENITVSSEFVGSYIGCPVWVNSTYAVVGYREQRAGLGGKF